MKGGYKGRKLNAPHTIVRRLVFFPLIQLARCLLFAAFALGWGLDEAKDTWHNSK